MKTKWIAITLFVAVAFFCADTAAAKDKNAKKETMYPALLTTSDIKGAKVMNLQNENIGDIDELLIEADTGLGGSNATEHQCRREVSAAQRRRTLHSLRRAPHRCAGLPASGPSARVSGCLVLTGS